MNTLYIILYIIGFISSYYYCRWIIKRKNTWDWEFIRIVALLSLFPIISPIIVTMIIGIDDVNKQPPKWL